MVAGNLGLPEWLVGLILLFIVPLVIVAWWRIFSKAGHPGAISLALLVPAVGFFVFLWFAFSDWPIEKKLRGNG
jgi:hypothetical protein